MKLSFSTVGCPDWSFGDIYSSAKDLGYDAIEIRGMGKEMYAPRIKEFCDPHFSSTMKKLETAGITISMFTSNSVIGSRTAENESRTEAYEYITLASKAGVPYVRLMISPNPYPEEVDLDYALEFYAEICEYAKDKDVIPLIETNGILAESAVMRRFYDSVKSENKGILWDINHPARFFSESADKTFSNIGEYVKYMHIKDSVEVNGKPEYRMMGYGNLPVFDGIKLMKNAGYDGFLSLEWTKRWCPDLEEAGIVFARYISFMKRLLADIADSD